MADQYLPYSYTKNKPKKLHRLLLLIFFPSITGLRISHTCNRKTLFSLTHHAFITCTCNTYTSWKKKILLSCFPILLSQICTRMRSENMDPYSQWWKGRFSSTSAYLCCNNPPPTPQQHTPWQHTYTNIQQCWYLAPAFRVPGFHG